MLTRYEVALRGRGVTVAAVALVKPIVEEAPVPFGKSWGLALDARWS